LRQDQAEFQARGAAVLIVGPDGPNAFRRYWEENDMPFTGLPDLRSRVAELYSQEVNLFKFGRLPALFVIDRQGLIRFAHYGETMRDIPPNALVLRVVDEIRQEEAEEEASADRAPDGV
jgi:peroxiredoxin Q/BCP